MTLQSIYDELEKKYPNEIAYLSAVKSLFDSVNETSFNSQELTIIKRLTTPNEIIIKDIIWNDDSNVTHINKAYRVWHNNDLGVYKGGNRFDVSVDISSLKALAFEQTFKNSLTSLPLGGAKGGSDFNPLNKSENEIRIFTEKFMQTMAPYFGHNLDVPAGDLGVGTNELNIMLETFLKINKDANIGFLTGKPVGKGGSLGRVEATGYGLCYIVNEALEKYFNTDFKGKKIIISGSGNVGIHAAEKASEMGAIVVGMSDIDGYIYNELGLNVSAVKEIKKAKLSISKYLDEFEDTVFDNNPTNLFFQPCEIIMPCATQNEIDEKTYDLINLDKVLIIAEGANRPLCNYAINKLVNQSNTLFIPGKAANAGGVCVSYFEMLQNDANKYLSFEEVDERLKKIMKEIFNNIYQTATNYNKPNNLLFGANLYSLKRLLDINLNNYHQGNNK